MNNSNVNISSITMIPIISPNEHPQQDHHHSLSYHQNNHRKWDIPINYKCENIKYELQFCDSNGVCCSLSQTNLSSGCCLASHHVLQHSINIPQFENKSLELYNMNHERYSCLQCDEQSHCCLEYHSCVTCCLHPFHLELSHSLHLKESHYASFQLKDVSNFEWCSFICRPSSVSLSDSENSYRSPYNFCFLSNGPPQVFASVNSDRKHLTIKKNDESSRQQKTPRQSQYRYLRSFLLHDRKTSLGN